MIGHVNRMAALLTIIVLAGTGALAQNRMWVIGVHICTIDGKCTNGVMNAQSAKRFVSKAECESAAQGIYNSLFQMKFDIKRIWCEQER